MSICTTPRPAPKPPFPSREEALAQGELVEIGDIDGPLGLLLPCALSQRLLDQTEEIPFAQIGQVTADDRLRRLLHRASRALERACGHYGRDAMGAMLHGFVLDFAVSLPRRAGDPGDRFARMHCGPDEYGDLVLTLGLSGEL